VVQKVAYILVDLDTAGRKKLPGGPSTSLDAYGPHARLARGLRVVRGVAQGKALRGLQLETLQRG
jgi:hypothetical protein